MDLKWVLWNRLETDERNLEGENPTPSAERDLKAGMRSMVFLGKWLEEENGVCPEIK